ncbi:MAG: aminopeptidase [bacterium]
MKGAIPIEEKRRLIDQGALQVVDNCLKIRRGENLVIITDEETRRLADPIAERAIISGASLSMFMMEDFGTRPEDGSTPLELSPEIAGALTIANASIYIAQIRPNELHSFRMPLIRLVEELGIKHAHMPMFTEQMMWQGMASDYDKIQRLSKKVFDIVSMANLIRVTTPAGTEAIFEFSRKYLWSICDGLVRLGEAANLPGGEVYGTPINANGTMVIDGGFGDFFSKKYGDISKTPLKYALFDGRCVPGSVECANKELKHDFERYTFESDDNSNRVGEFAFGTNIGLTEIIGNMLQDEKLPGVHVALGSPLPDTTKAAWDSVAHNDGLLRHPTVEVDGRIIMKSGQHLLDY